MTRLEKQPTIHGPNSHKLRNWQEVPPGGRGGAFLNRLVTTGILRQLEKKDDGAHGAPGRGDPVSADTRLLSLLLLRALIVQSTLNHIHARPVPRHSSFQGPPPPPAPLIAQPLPFASVLFSRKPVSRLFSPPLARHVPDLQIRTTGDQIRQNPAAHASIAQHTKDPSRCWPGTPQHGLYNTFPAHPAHDHDHRQPQTNFAPTHHPI
ncbi:hypothetical protein QBC40DRAFT_60433 [Triangularia verruculosa]|uniref:Uncharacterized protein n=1 Tax=Triangularia verruculosa TaxID=2587418 RepID=A0AAN6XJI0_9PEZI|nr:hypothetical protein QBC40DRAFT_60433 [Triangularia verruculosa]